ncbi:MAG: DUF4330 family protein [Candidatus Omnitrophota bacterium]
MKIIDEKGRLFGKVNVIDFLAMLLLLSILPVFYFGYKIANQKPIAPPKTFTEVELYCRFIKLAPSVAEMISVGDKEFDEKGDVTAEIIELGKIELYVYELDIGAGERLVKEDLDKKQVSARLKLKAELREDKLYYKNKPIAISLPLDFKTNKYEVIAIPREEEKKEEERMIDLYVTLKDLDEDTLKNLSVGDKELDRNGEVIMEILTLGKMENSAYDFDLGAGNFILGEDSNKKQLSAKIRLKCKVKNNNQLYFKGKKIGHNILFEFKTDKYVANASVSKTLEMSPIVKERWISLQVKFAGEAPEIARVIQKGDIEKDVFGKTVARIGSIISDKASEVLVLKDDRFITLNHPFNKDMLLSLDVKCIEKDGVYYFENYPVKMGNMINFMTDLYSISGTIVGVEMQ